MAEKIFPCPYTMVDYYKKNCVHFMYNKDKTLKNYFQMLVTALANIPLQLHFSLWGTAASGILSFGYLQIGMPLHFKCGRNFLIP